MATVEVSNTFLIGVIVVFIIVRLLCECTQDSHMRPKVPSDVLFTMNSIPNFVATPDGQEGPLADFIDQLCLHGDQLSGLIEPIRVVYDHSRWWTIDNRRLFALRKAEQRGAVGYFRHKVVKLDDPTIRQEFESKKCNKHLGKKIHVAVDPGFRWGPEYDLN